MRRILNGAGRRQHCLWSSRSTRRPNSCRIPGSPATPPRRRGSSPSSAQPPIETAPDSISVKSCRTHTSGRRAAARPASPAMNPVAVALCRPSANTSCTAATARPPCNVASTSACPSATRPGAPACAGVSMRSMLPRKAASVLVRAPVMRLLVRIPDRHGQENQKLAHLFMICSNIKLTWPRESIVSGIRAIH